MGKSLTMAWRNMWRNWRRTAIELIAIVLGLILLLFMDGLIKGSDQAIFGNPVRLYGGNIQVHAPGFREKAHQLPLLPLEDADAVVQAARAQPQVVAAAKRINTPGLVSSREGAFPGVITGVEPAVEAPLSIQAENVAAGRFLLAEKAVIAALQPALPNYEVDSWETLRPEMRQTTDTKVHLTGMSLYVFLNLIVILIVAVIIANTLLMAIFERIREMGLLAALGMKGRQIMLMFLLEGFILGLAGVVIGFILGSLGVAYLAKVGIYIGEEVASTAGSVALGTTMYARFAPGTFASLSIWTLIIVLLASLYAAWFAARLQPIRALHSS